MKCFNLIFMFVVLVAPVHSFSFASEIDDAKTALIESIPTLSGEGAEVSGPMSIEEIEKKSTEEISECKDCPQVPFGFQNAKWEKFKSEYKDGDIILYFHTNRESWAGLYGREGYALVRGKEIIDSILTKMN